MFRLIVLVAALAAISACAQHRVDISRFDGRKVDPVHEEQSKVECRGKATVAGAHTPDRRYGSGFDGLANMAIQDNVRKQAFESCMAEKGLRVTWTEVQS